MSDVTPAGGAHALPAVDSPELTGATRRVALGVSYVGSAYKGWQSQPSGGTDFC